MNALKHRIVYIFILSVRVYINLLKSKYSFYLYLSVLVDMLV